MAIEIFIQEGQIGIDDTEKIAVEARVVLRRIDILQEKLDDEKLERARKKLEVASQLDCRHPDPEELQKASNDMLEAKRLLGQTRGEHLKAIRQIDSDRCISFFEQVVRPYARESECRSYDNLKKTAQRSIDRNDSDFEGLLDEMKTRNTVILMRQDWFVIDWFHRLTKNSCDYFERAQFHNLQQKGLACIAYGDIDQLRQIIGELFRIKVHNASGEDMLETANIIRG